MDLGGGSPNSYTTLGFWYDISPPPLSFGYEKGGGFLSRSPTVAATGIFHYTTSLNFCQEKSCTNIEKIKIPILCILPIAI